MVGALFSTSGPPYVIYLSRRLRDKSELRSSFSVVIMMESALRLTVFLAAGLVLQEHMLTALLLALPLMAFGLHVGNRIHLDISQTLLMRLVGLLLTASGLSLISKSGVMARFS